MSSLDYLDLCRLCLVKDRVSVPIFGGEGNDLFLKIAACLPVKVGREDKLPKKICDDCVYKVELFYEFWNTTANAEKRLLQWLGEVNVESGKQGYVPNVLNPNVMKQEQSTENRLDGSVMQQVGEHQNNMGMSMMDNMGLGIPMMIRNTNQQQQQITSVPMDTSGSPAQNVQAVPGPSSQTTHNQISQNQTSSTQQEDEEESSEDDENSDDECDGDEGLPVKEESEEDPNSRTIEPTTFVNVSLACDEAGPSGLQQQKITDMPEMPISQSADGDPKTGSRSLDEIYNPQKYPKYADGSAEINITNHSKQRLLEEATPSRRIRCSARKLPAKGAKVLVSPTAEIAPEAARIKSSEPLKCDHCGKEFFQKSQLVAHLKTYKHRCSSCNRVFRLKNELRLHSNEKHGPLTYPCTICEYKSTNKWTLKDHIIRKHTSSYQYSCAVCQKKFKLKNDLKQHTNQVHNDAPPIICTVCGHASKSVPASKAHMRYRHCKPAFECSICKRCLSTENSLEQHLLWHTKKEKVVCPTCGKTFGQKRDLEIHLRIHEGLRPYSCSFCGKTFRRRNAQEQHMLIHTGMRPYTCDICGQGFAQKPGLICHRKRHPGPLPPLPVISVKKLIMDYTRGLREISTEFRGSREDRKIDGDRVQEKGID